MYIRIWNLELHFKQALIFNFTWSSNQLTKFELWCLSKLIVLIIWWSPTDCPLTLWSSGYCPLPSLSLTYHEPCTVLTNEWLTHKDKCPTHKNKCPAHKIEWLIFCHEGPICDSPSAMPCTDKWVAHICEWDIYLYKWATHLSAQGIAHGESKMISKSGTSWQKLSHSIFWAGHSLLWAGHSLLCKAVHEWTHGWSGSVPASPQIPPRSHSDSH